MACHQAIRLAFDAGISELAGHERPRDEDLDALAGDLGRIFAEDGLDCDASRPLADGGDLDRCIERAIAGRERRVARKVLLDGRSQRRPVRAFRRPPARGDRCREAGAPSRRGCSGSGRGAGTRATHEVRSA